MWSQTGSHRLQGDVDMRQYQDNVLHHFDVAGSHLAARSLLRASDEFWLHEKVLLRNLKQYSTVKIFRRYFCSIDHN